MDSSGRSGDLSWSLLVASVRSWCSPGVFRGDRQVGLKIDSVMDPSGDLSWRSCAAGVDGFGDGFFW